MYETQTLYVRMKQAVQWIKQNKQMLQKDIAAKMGITEVAFSNGMKRIKEKADDDFVISFHQATDEVFSLEWLLNGTLPKFADQNQKNFASEQPIDNSSAINAALASRDEIIASIYAHLDDKDKQIAKLYEDKDEMRRAKDETISELRKRLTEKDESIADLRQRISESKKEIVNRVAMLEKQIADKDDMIAILNQHITDLKIRLSRHDTEDLNKYPFPVGTADSQNPMKKRAKK